MPQLQCYRSNGAILCAGTSVGWDALSAFLLVNAKGALVPTRLQAAGQPLVRAGHDPRDLDGGRSRAHGRVDGVVVAAARGVERIGRARRGQLGGPLFRAGAVEPHHVRVVAAGPIAGQDAEVVRGVTQ